MTDLATDRQLGAARWATPRTDRPTALPEAERIAELLGFQLMPWQKQILAVALEYEPSSDVPGGRQWAYREVRYGTPRQSGKSVLSLVKLAHRSLMMGDKQESVYTMQTGADAARRLLDEWAPDIEDSDLGPAVARVRRTAGSEQMRFKNRSTIEILRSGKSAGHGRTLDEGHIDEAMHDVDDRREQAIVPAQITRPNAQLLIYSTAGTDESLFWRRKVDEGREFVQDGLTDAVCYFEWSFPEDVDIYDHDVWREYHPAIGHTQSVKAIDHAAKTMAEHEFRRAFGNQWTRSDDKVIDWATWVECRSTAGQIGNELVLAVDLNKDRTAASICAASRASDGLVDIELIARDDGLSWVIPRLLELQQRHNPYKIILDGSGPIGAMLPEMLSAGLFVEAMPSVQLPKACGAFYDAITERRLRVRPNDQLDDAVAGAAKWVRGDSFIWRRQSAMNDISPLVTATLAHWAIAGDSNHGAMWVY